jgi:hypothetical protein
MVLFLLVAASVGSGLPFREHAAVQESLMAKGSLMGHRWLEKNGLESYLLRQSWRPTEDSGLKCVGRWSYGPSLKVSLRVSADDTIVCLTRGSGATLARFNSRDSVTFDLLGDLDFAGIPRRAIIADTLVVAGIHFGGAGVEVHGVSDPARPNLLSRIVLPMVNDIAVRDSFVYVACEDDTLRIYDIANPRLPFLVGACSVGCDLFMTEVGNYCYLVDVSGVNIVDVSNPASPHRAGHIGGGEPLAVYVRDTLCYVTVYQYGLRIWNIANVGSPVPVGSLSGPDAIDLTMSATCDTMLYTSYLDVVSVADPAKPVLVGSLGRSASGVAALPALNYVLLAVDGLTAVDIATPSAPQQGTYAFSAGSAIDIAVDGTRAYVGSYNAGMAILDVSDPTRPVTLGGLDYRGSLPTCLSVAARDSFAFLSWEPGPQFQTALVSDPAKPVLVGGDTLFGRPEDLVLRDSYVYCAMLRRFQVVDIAQPRQPVLVGSCLTGDATSASVCVQETLAYIGNFVGDVVNVRDRANPQVLGHFGRGAWNVSVRDTFAFVSCGGILVYSVADPARPRLIDSLSVGSGTDWVEAVGSLLYTGHPDGVRVIDASDVHNMRVRGAAGTPRAVDRLAYRSPYLYVSCWEAGVCIFESTEVGVAEPGSRLERRARSCPTVLRAAGWKRLTDGGAVVFDAMGRRVTQAKPGVYFIVEEPQALSHKLQAIRKVVLAE